MYGSLTFTLMYPIINHFTFNLLYFRKSILSPQNQTHTHSVGLNHVATCQPPLSSVLFIFHLSQVIVPVLILFFWIWQAEKLQTKTVPFPYTSKDVFHQSMRMPIGPESNPATTFGPLTRPEVSFSKQFLGKHFILLFVFIIMLYCSLYLN